MPNCWKSVSPLACEAALALAHLPPGAGQALLTCVADRHATADLRTAAACALLQHGQHPVRAAAFVGAIVRAGTPAGRADEADLGLPEKPRWALERYFVLRMLRRLGHEDLADELDPDAPWPQLEALAPRITARLAP